MSSTQEPTTKPRVLLFVVAYEAESTLARVLERIPSAIREFDVEVLVIDDSSRDKTFEVGLEAAAALGHRITVLYNRTNQGYGGNQKLGYKYAARERFDYVVLLHGDGQYAPECIPELLAPLISGTADAVFGSRMLVRGAARRGGMPAYKFVGNKVLTWIQNRLLRTQLSEFHSGFRAYRVTTLEQIPFEYNANGFHFDTEIIIQLVLGRHRIVEVPIPTYYGDEICRVNGVRYAMDVILATAGSVLHQLNVLYDRRFDVQGGSNTHYSLKLGYDSSHTRALAAVPWRSRVLDIGCGPGEFARELAKKGCVIDGVDQFAPADTTGLRNCWRWSEPEPFAVDMQPYDCVLMLDVIEHFTQPELFLSHLRAAAPTVSRQQRFIVTTGNVAFAIVRLQLLLGNFNYGRRGILDLTHTRLYTFKSLRRLFEQCGYRIERIEGIPAPYPLALGNTWFARALVRLNAALIRVSRGFFSYQMLAIVTPLPTVDDLLNDSIAGSARKAAEVRHKAS